MKKKTKKYNWKRMAAELTDEQRARAITLAEEGAPYNVIIKEIFNLIFSSAAQDNLPRIIHDIFPEIPVIRQAQLAEKRRRYERIMALISQGLKTRDACRKEGVKYQRFVNWRNKNKLKIPKPRVKQNPFEAINTPKTYHHTCNRCGKTFITTHKDIHTCPDCKEINSRIYADAWGASGGSGLNI